VTTTSTSVRARFVAGVVSLLLLVGAQMFGAAPKAMAALPVSISGTIFDSVSAQPLAGVTISDTGGSATATSANDGTYTLQVDPGTHVLKALLDGYVPMSSAVLPNLVQGASITGINVTLQKYASASGTVLGSVTKTGVSGVAVHLYDAGSVSQDTAYTTSTSADGSWVLANIVPGTYKVKYDAAGTHFMTLWYDQKSTRDAATILTVAPGAALTLSAFLVTESTVSGTVRNADGTTLANATVNIQRQNGTAVATTTTDANGAYTFHQLGADTYLIRASLAGYASTWYGNGAVHQDQAQTIAVAESQDVTGKDITLAAGGSISGTVTPQPAKTGTAGVLATAHGDWYWAGVGTDGTYALTNLPTGDYIVQFYAVGYMSEYYNDVTSSGSATTVHVTAGATTSGIDAVLTAGIASVPNPASISGRVVDLDGNGLGGVTVLAPLAGSATTTAPDGRYSLTVTTTDSQLTFTRDGYVTEAVSVSPGSTTTTVDNPYVVPDVQLSRIVTIRGTVTAGIDGPLAHAQVSIYTPLGLVATALTDANGAYTVTDLRENSYAISADSINNQAYAAAFYGGASVSSLAKFVSAPEGSTLSNIDIHLDQVASIVGSVTWSGGPAVGAKITAASAGVTETVTVDPNGTFSVGGLPAGSYRVSAYLSSWGQVWWNSATTELTATPVVVTAGQSESGINITLADGHTVSGTVTSSKGALQDGAPVSLLGPDGLTQTTMTGSDGTYAFHGIPTGSYGIGVSVNQQILWLPGSRQEANAARFMVDHDITDNITLPAFGTVTVHVTGTSTPSTGGVEAFDQFGDSVGTGLVSNGVATLSLLSGSYLLKATVDGYETTGVQATVTDGSVVTIALQQGATITGSISGNATSTTVLARNVATGEAFTANGDAGTYTLAGLPAGTYVIASTPYSADGPCGPLAWYDGKTSYLDATRIPVQNGVTTPIDLSSTCPAAATTYTVSGTMTLPSGVTLSDPNRYQVGIFLTDTTTNLQVANTFPNVDGTFSFTKVPAGTYVVSASGASLNLADASTVVTVVASDMSMTLAMPLAGTVTGRVLDVFGHQVAVTVTAAATKTPINTIYAVNGVFSVSGLPAGDYALTITPPTPYAQVTITPVHVTLGHTTDIGTVTLQATGRITGTLPSNLFGATSITVDATDASGTVLATTTVTQGGEYALWGVPAGSVYVRFSGGVDTEWWKDAATLSAATPVTVVANEAAAGISPILTVTTVTYETISGTVTGPDGPLTGASITADNGTTSLSTVSASDGTYSLSVPAGATYTLTLNVCLGAKGELGCAGESYTDTRKVTVGSTSLTGLDWTLGALQAFTNAPLPTITGTATVGQMLTASAGDWQPTPDTVTWAWFADSASIGGATGQSLLLTPDLVGKTITVQATATKTGYVTQTTTSLPTGPVVPAVLTPGTVSIQGTPTVGISLIAQVKDWPTAATITYQWLRGTTPIVGATSLAYAPVAADVDQTLTVVVTATEDGFPPVSSSDTSAPVQKGVMARGTVSINGTAQVGQTLTAAPASWPQQATLIYQWLRDGSPIVTPPSQTYVLSAADIGHTFSVIVTASQDGYELASATSPTAGPVQPLSMSPGTVTILGTPLVGQALVATLASWPDGATLTYQWSRNGVAIGGATSATYSPVGADAGAALTLTVAATKLGYATVSASAQTAAVEPGTIRAGMAAISGAAQVGATLSVTSTGWTPGDVTLGYQWLRDGAAISGATTASYAPVLADVGHTLSVTVTGTKTGYTPASVTSSPTAVVPALTMTGAVTISGTAAVGSALTANATFVPADAALSYQWLRNGATIAGAARATYTPVAADLGARLSVTVTGVKQGYVSATVTSAQTAAVQLQRVAVVAGTVTISGTPLVTMTLTAQPGTWSPSYVRLTYQWLRDGVAIAGETGSTYTVGMADLGHRLTVSVTGSRPGYVSATAISAATAMVAQPRVTAGTVTIAGTPAVDSRLTVQPGTWSPGNLRLSYQWRRDGVAISGATRSGYTVTLADVGHVLSVSVTGTRSGYIPATAVSAPTAVVAQARVVAGTVMIWGNPNVSSTLFAVPGGWEPANVSLSYQWLRDGVAIPAANRRTYTVTRADVGHTLSVAVTGSALGYLPTMATSPRSAVVRAG
jgi:hypothetical protein